MPKPPASPRLSLSTALLVAVAALSSPPPIAHAQGVKDEPGARTKVEPKAKAKVDRPPRAADLRQRRLRRSPRQVLDFYKADTTEPAPLVVYIHGGGWVNGDKYGIGASTSRRSSTSGISVAAINYRYTTQADEAGVKPPVKWPLEDAARAVQFLRSKAGEWNIDKTRVGATGGSAGACSSLWLAFHDDMAKPDSPDPVARESTRLTCAAVNGAQTSLDPKQLREWMPNMRYGGHAFGFRGPIRRAATRSSSGSTTTATRCSPGSRNTRPTSTPGRATRRSSSTTPPRTSPPASARSRRTRPIRPSWG